MSYLQRSDLLAIADPRELTGLQMFAFLSVTVKPFFLLQRELRSTLTRLKEDTEASRHREETLKEELVALHKDNDFAHTQVRPELVSVRFLVLLLAMCDTSVPDRYLMIILDLC